MRVKSRFQGQKFNLLVGSLERRGFGAFGGRVWPC